MRRTKSQNGFSIIELLVVMAIFTFVIAGASQMFVSILSGAKQQSRMAVTNIEGIIGLEVMRRDIQNAGYGLFTDPGSVDLKYAEVAEDVDKAGFDLNDDPENADLTKRPPKALAVGAGTYPNGSDRLAIKGTSVGLSDHRDAWTYNKLNEDKTTSENWNQAALDDLPKENDRVIMLSLDLKEDESVSKKILVPNTGTGFFTQFKDSETGFSPSRKKISAIYFVDDGDDPKMPFNRADYYIEKADPMPVHCANGTGMLYKDVVRNLVNSKDHFALPVLECVADMQVALVLAQPTGTGLVTAETTTALTAQSIRLTREVRVYILAQEGQYDRSFTYGNSQIWVGEQGAPVVGTVGRAFDLSANVTDWQRFRWKLYTMVVRPTNIR